MLSAADLLLIVGTAAGCTAVVALLTFLILRLNRRGAIFSQFAIVVIAAILSIICSTVAIAAEMYLSQHDLQVLLWVIGISAVMSLIAALLTARPARNAVIALRESAKRIGQGEVIDADSASWKEFAEVSTQLAEASERLAAARGELEQLDASRRQFFAWISHDLRTPLTGVSALAEALEEGIVEDPLEYIRQIRARTETMSRLVDDLFELSKLHSGTLQLRREEVELLDVVSDAVSDVQGLAVSRNIRITQSGVAGHMLWADPHELTRVIVNLLTNSIKYAPEGSEVLVSAQAQNDDRLTLSVLDQGHGVASEDLGRMFEVGWRASASRTPDSQGPQRTTPGPEPSAVQQPGSSGAGLGLAIVRGIVEAHGGDVQAEHAVPGFRLTVILPRTVG
ncbi:sensor histidine kinase [Psychromicrobium sp. YIM B11713]|uniref:sensor histidine kinase n=1 Tax=Psychromicrobium sp. YIM B11713 TaxID=3145233 RepID=UPI00374F0B0F